MIISVDCLRRIIYFKEEEQKELQILILNLLEGYLPKLNFIENVISKFSEDILTFVKRTNETDQESKKKNLFNYIKESRRDKGKIETD